MDAELRQLGPLRKGRPLGVGPQTAHCQHSCDWQKDGQGWRGGRRKETGWLGYFTLEGTLMDIKKLKMTAIFDEQKPLIPSVVMVERLKLESCGL